MQGIKRKIVYITLYELIAIACATVGLALLSGKGAQTSGILAALASCVAMVWNYIYNTAFEAWEARQQVRGRRLALRMAHALGFELGLVMVLVPLMAWWFDISLWDALILDIGLIVFFLFYTFCFNWAFDKFFGLPDSAKTA